MDTLNDDYFQWRRAQLQRVSSVGYRVVRAAAAACPGDIASLGIIIEHRDQISPVDRVAAGWADVDGLPRIAAVAAGSPASTAGLTRGDLLQLWPPGGLAPTPHPSFAGVERAIDLIEARMLAAMRADKDRPVLRLPIERNGIPQEISIPLHRGCGAWFDLKQEGPADASSNGRWIQTTDAVMKLVAGDDDGLAFIVGHELAHRLMRRRPGKGSATCGFGCEQEADRLGMEFATRAGFAAERAPDVLKALAEVRQGFLGTRRGALMRRASSLQGLIEAQSRADSVTQIDRGKVGGEPAINRPLSRAVALGTGR